MFTNLNYKSNSFRFLILLQKSEWKLWKLKSLRGLDNRKIDFFIIGFLKSISLPFSYAADLFLEFERFFYFTAMNAKQDTGLVIMHVQL